MICLKEIFWVRYFWTILLSFCTARISAHDYWTGSPLVYRSYFPNPLCHRPTHWLTVILDPADGVSLAPPWLYCCRVSHTNQHCWGISDQPAWVSIFLILPLLWEIHSFFGSAVQKLGHIGAHHSYITELTCIDRFTKKYFTLKENLVFGSNMDHFFLKI